MTDNTVLALSGVGIPPYSARGLQQTLEPIQQAIQLRRTINGALTDASVTQMQKYSSTITGNDQQPPAVDGVWPGRVVVVDCIKELAVLDAGTDTELGRTAVAGSLRTEGDFLFYRPRLTMRVVSFTLNTDEWDAQIGWSMVLEEV